MFRRSLVLILTILATHPALADTAVAPPGGVVAVRSPVTNAMELYWLPPMLENDIDYYRVYGFVGATAYLLDETDEIHASVASGYSRYGVSTVKNGVESAAAEASPVCVETHPGQIPPVSPEVPCQQ